MTDDEPMKLGDVFRDAEVARLYSYRAPYPAAVFTLLRRLLVAPGTILDAGAGTGALARGMLPFAQRIDAVDPSDAMIAAGRRSPNGDDRRIRWLVGRAEDAPISPPYGLITCGASLHWMDLDSVLPRFHTALAPGAVVAIVDTDNVHGPYHDDVLAVIRRYSELEHHAGMQDLIGTLEAGGHFVVLGTERTDPTPVEQSVDEYVEFLHSTSTLARIRLGERSAAFDDELRSILVRHGIERLHYDVVGTVTWGRPRYASISCAGPP